MPCFKDSMWTSLSIQPDVLLTLFTSHNDNSLARQSPTTVLPAVTGKTCVLILMWDPVCLQKQSINSFYRSHHMAVRYLIWLNAQPGWIWTPDPGMNDGSHYQTSESFYLPVTWINLASHHISLLNVVHISLYFFHQKIIEFSIELAHLISSCMKGTSSHQLWSYWVYLELLDTSCLTAALQIQIWA